jgi:hypothetical protein
MDFEIFKSNVCHMVKNMGDIPFLIEALQSDKIHRYFQEKKYLECFYLVGMVDYLSRENDISICTNFDYIRKYSFERPVYPRGIITLSLVLKSEEPKEKSLKEAIPEFLHFNIVEAEIRNVF